MLHEYDIKILVLFSQNEMENFINHPALKAHISIFHVTESTERQRAKEHRKMDKIKSFFYYFQQTQTHNLHLDINNSRTKLLFFIIWYIDIDLRIIFIHINGWNMTRRINIKPLKFIFWNWNNAEAHLLTKKKN